MSQKTKLNIAYLGIVNSILYLLVVAGYFITETNMALTCWQVVIIISAPVILIVLLSILENSDNTKISWKMAAISFMTCTTALTGVSHFVNITVTRNLEANGINVPDYFKIGQLPSVQWAIDYLAWGFFMGLAFIFTAAAISPTDTYMKRVRLTLIISGCLCLLGMSSPIFSNEILWFIAVVGYAIGTPVICVQMISFYKKQSI